MFCDNALQLRDHIAQNSCSYFYILFHMVFGDGQTSVNMLENLD